MADIIGSVLFDPDNYEIKYLKKDRKNKKNPGFSGFFAWLDQYIWLKIQYIVKFIDGFEHETLKN